MFDLKQCDRRFLVLFYSLDVRTTRLDEASRSRDGVCVWSHGQQFWCELILTLWTRTWFPVATSCRLLLLLVIDITSKAFTHPRHSHNSELAATGKTATASLSYVRLSRETARYYENTAQRFSFEAHTLSGRKNHFCTPCIIWCIVFCIIREVRTSRRPPWGYEHPQLITDGVACAFAAEGSAWDCWCV